jgi:hypothetical protein
MARAIPHFHVHRFEHYVRRPHDPLLVTGVALLAAALVLLVLFAERIAQTGVP